MSKLYIVGGNKLNGELNIPSAKNTLLPILAGCILVNGEVKIHNFTMYKDCKIMIKILKSLGAKISLKYNTIKIDCSNIDNWTITTELANKLRSSFFTLGAILGRLKLAKVAYPGGCDIGARPVNIHLKALRDLGVSIIERHGYIYCNGENLHSGEVNLDFPTSVGATENMIMACCSIKGTTILKNCAKEPEIIDLQNFLNLCGAKISGAGTDTITIVGVGGLLHGTEYTCISDRIIAGTYAIAVASTGGNVTLNNINPNHNKVLFKYLQDAGAKVDIYDSSVTVISSAKLKSIQHIETMPYPFFPTDLQSQMMVMQTISLGNSIISENIFEARFKIVPELIKMGAKITIKNNVAYVCGVEHLYGAEVYATDLRAGAGLVIAGLVADGYTTVSNVEYIDRGYLNIENDLANIGANIKRIE